MPLILFLALFTSQFAQAQTPPPTLPAGHYSVNGDVQPFSLRTQESIRIASQADEQRVSELIQQGYECRRFPMSYAQCRKFRAAALFPQNELSQILSSETRLGDVALGTQRRPAELITDGELSREYLIDQDITVAGHRSESFRLLVIEPTSASPEPTLKLKIGRPGLFERETWEFVLDRQNLRLGTFRSADVKVSKMVVDSYSGLVWRQRK